MPVLPGIVYGVVVVILPLTTLAMEKSSAQYDIEFRRFQEREICARELITQEQFQGLDTCSADKLLNRSVEIQDYSNRLSLLKKSRGSLFQIPR